MKTTKSTILKTLGILLVAMMLLGMTACGEDSDKYVYFKNDLSTTVDEFYISSVDEDEWGDPLNTSSVSKGKRIRIDAGELVDGAGTYDIGAYDANGMNYDVYGVYLTPGSTVSLSSRSDTAIVTVTELDGTQTEYFGEVYED